MTTAQMVSLSSLDAEVGGTAGAVRTVSARNKFPIGQVQMLTTVLYHAFRMNYIIGSGAVADIRLAFPNSYLYPASGPGAGQQDIIIDMVTLEYPTGGTWKAVTFSASRSKTLTNTDYKFMADTILPSDLGFSDVTGIPVGTELFVKGYLHVANANEYIPQSRSVSEPNQTIAPAWAVGPLQAHIFDTAVTTITNVDGNGMLTHTGTIPVPIGGAEAYCPIMLGTFISGDPKTCGMFGDSIMLSSGLYGAQQWAMWDADHVSNPVASIEIARGGMKQSDFNTEFAIWSPYLTNFRTVFENLGTNQSTISTGLYDLMTLWQSYFTGGVEKIIRTELVPKVSTTSDNWATEVNQSGMQNHVPFNFGIESMYDNRSLNGFCAWGVGDGTDGIRGTTDATKWYASGVAYHSTKDGTHPSTVSEHAIPHGQSMMETAARTAFQAVTVPQP